MRIAILLAIFFASDLYLYQALKKALSESSRLRKKIWKVFFWMIPILFSICVIGAYFSESRFWFYPILVLILIYLSKWLGILILAMEDITRIVRFLWQQVQKLWTPKHKSIPGTPISRSTFVAQSALAATAIHTGAFGWGVISGAHDYRFHRITLPLKNLPTAFDGMVIGQLSDIHSGSFFNKKAVLGGVEMLMKEKPEAIFFTGDLVNNEAKELNDYFDVFKKIKAPLGVYSVTGNHDYGDYHRWSSEQEKTKNFEKLMAGHKTLGWQLLMDSHAPLTINNESLGVLGIQNWGAGGFSKYGDLSKALYNTDDYAIKLLLSHDPSHWREQVLGKTTIDAAFAGHTHGMQYGVELGSFRFSPVQLRYKEWAGLYEENNQFLYVNRGFGYLGYPGRIGILPEITLITLKKA